MSKISDYKPNRRNPNKGTQRGLGMVEDSMREDGAARSIVVAADNTIIAGNHAQEGAVLAGIEDAIEVEVSGDQLVVVKRTDWANADDPGAIRYAYRDNRSTETNLVWEAAQLLEDMDAGVDLIVMFTQEELEALIGDALKEPPEFKEYDESVADEVEFITCPHCGEQFPQ